MKSDMQWQSVGDLVVNYDRLRKPLSSRERENRKGPYPYYGAACIFDYIDDYIFDGEYILLGEDGTVINEDGTPVLQRISGKTWVNNHAHVLKNSELVDFDYLYYALKNAKFRSAVTGAVQPKISQSNMNAVRVLIHSDREEQKKVAAILKSLDDKIALNEEINDNLEQQAVLLFRSWFSTFSQSENVSRNDSEFGEIPVDFSVVKIGNLPMLVTDYVANGSFASLKENVTLYQEPNYAYFVRNTDLKSGSFGAFVDQHSYEFLSKSTLYGGEIIISNVGDVGSVFLCPTLDRPMTLGNNIIMLRPEDDMLRYYLYIWFKHLQGQALIQGIKGGSAQPKFNKTDFKKTSVILPPTGLLSRFHDTVAPMFEAIDQNRAENARLSSLRDALLPRLMSGELDVSYVDL